MVTLGKFVSRSRCQGGRIELAARGEGKMEAWGGEHAMLVGRAFQEKFRDKKYPVPEASNYM
jgi:hypothetical protein